jgi:hypothetical protein
VLRYPLRPGQRPPKSASGRSAGLLLTRRACSVHPVSCRLSGPSAHNNAQSQFCPQPSRSPVTVIFCCQLRTSCECHLDAVVLWWRGEDGHRTIDVFGETPASAASVSGCTKMHKRQRLLACSAGFPERSHFMRQLNQFQLLTGHAGGQSGTRIRAMVAHAPVRSGGSARPTAQDAKMVRPISPTPGKAPDDIAHPIAPNGLCAAAPRGRARGPAPRNGTSIRRAPSPARSTHGRRRLGSATSLSVPPRRMDSPGV